MRKKIFLLVVLFVNICCMLVYGDSQKIKNPANGHWYQRFDTPMSWYYAKAYCESLGGHLATITSAEENNFVYSNVVVNPNSQVLECWLGATDEESEGYWKWVTGEAWNYTNWLYGQPDNGWGNEDYLTIFTSVNPERISKWNDRDYNYNYSTICEWEAEKQTITVTSPNGGESWAVGSSHPITWTSTGAVDNVKIEYSTDNGTSWATIISSAVNTGSYNWIVPNTVSSQCKVKISEAATGIPSDTSYNTFSIYKGIPSEECIVMVDAKMNVFASGRDLTDQCGGGFLPVQINLPSGKERRFIFGAVGNNLSCCNGEKPHDADGGSYVNLGTYIIFPSGSLSGIKHYTRDIFLTGVFLDDSYPSGQAPPMLSYYSPLDQSQKPANAISDQSDEFCPGLRQVFFIGDGMAEMGEFQVFHVPNNATRLYLGFADAYNFGWPGGGQPGCYLDNTGSILVTIKSANKSIKVLSPNGGERWAVNDKHTIKWNTEGTVRNVKIEYTTNNGATWSTITSYTPNKDSYAWNVPNTPSSQCKIRVGEYHHGIPADTSDAVFSITATSTISLSRAKLNFCSLTSGTSTAPQEVSITNSDSGTLKWNISVDAPWLICSPGSGIGNGAVLISINSTGLTLGTYTGKVMISDPNATNSPQAVFVTLKVKSASQYTGPFGEFSTPVDGSTVRSSIPVTGWALDDVEIQSVKIYREDGDTLVLIGDVLFVEGTRPDVEAAYPDYPFNYKAGWGYMLLTNFLPNGGNGVFKLHAVAASIEGKTTDLGVKTIMVDNAHAVKPFGAIDTPNQGDIATGKHFINSGWILTPMPNMIPTDGSTIGVWIDGVYIGRPVYNKYREDIAVLFPGYANSNGAACYYYLDTTAYKNAIHTIQWTATDSGGNIDGIGSRYFSIQNLAIPGAGGANDQTPGIRYQGSEFRRGEPVCSPNSVQCLPVKNSFGSVDIVKGYREDAATTPQTVYPNEDGIIAIEIKELERIEIHFPVSPVNNISPLPIGSTLDIEKGIFYWQPGPGFIGEYHFVFIEKDETGVVNRKDVIINIAPGY